MMNMETPDVKLLRCFETLMAERNVSRAAARLNLTQPAMSHALSKLRRLFDDPLLLKGAGGMIATARALELAPQVRSAVEGIECLVRRPSPFDAATAQATFTIVAAETVEYMLAPPLINLLRREAPGVIVEFHPPDLQRALAMLERGEIDFRIGQWPRPPAQTLRCKALYRDRMVCIARKGHRDIKGDLNLRVFRETPHVRIRTARIGPSMEALDRAVARYGKLHVALRVHNAFAMAQVVACTDLIACVTERIASRLAAMYPLQIAHLPLPIPDMRISLYWHERTHRQPAHRWFRQLLTEAVKAV